MQLRCPNQGCSITVPDDLVGVKIRCPSCLQLILVDPKARDVAAEQIQAEAPVMSLDRPRPPSRAPIKLENRLYDGMPPLSVMMALRAQQKGLADDEVDLDIRQKMTDDDWKALAAFEKLLYAVTTLRTALWYGIAACALNGIVQWASDQFAGMGSVSTPFRLEIFLLSLFPLGGSFFLMAEGRERLGRLHLGLLVFLLPWCTLVVVLGLGVNVWLNLVQLFASASANGWVLLVFLSIPINLMAAVDAGMAGKRVIGSLRKLHPPDVLMRLTDAMQFMQL